MNPLLRDMYGHQAWADAEHWQAIGAHAPAREDAALRRRLHHIHLVQRFFMWAVGERQIEPAITSPEELQTFGDLKVFARGSHERIEQVLHTMSESRLSEPVVIPWFKDPPLSITVLEALTQCAMHSHYHRGQNATRLRELGGEPPTTDLIVWFWKGRPLPSWL